MSACGYEFYFVFNLIAWVAGGFVGERACEQASELSSKATKFHKGNLGRRFYVASPLAFTLRLPNKSISYTCYQPEYLTCLLAHSWSWDIKLTSQRWNLYPYMWLLSLCTCTSRNVWWGCATQSSNSFPISNQNLSLSIPFFRLTP